LSVKKSGQAKNLAKKRASLDEKVSELEQQVGCLLLNKLLF